MNKKLLALLLSFVCLTNTILSSQKLQGPSGYSVRQLIESGKLSLEDRTFADVAGLVTTNLSNLELNSLDGLQDGAIGNVLILSHNNFHEVPAELLTGLENFVLVDLSYNKIAELPENMSGLNIVALDFSHNNIATWPKNMSGINALDLSHNKIASWPEDMSVFADLNFLGLAYNQLTAIPEKLFEAVGQNTSFNLKGNLLNKSSLELLNKNNRDTHGNCVGQFVY